MKNTITAGENFMGDNIVELVSILVNPIIKKNTMFRTVVDKFM